MSFRNNGRAVRGRKQFRPKREKRRLLPFGSNMAENFRGAFQRLASQLTDDDTDNDEERQSQEIRSLHHHENVPSSSNFSALPSDSNFIGMESRSTRHRSEMQSRKSHPKGLKGKEIGLWYRDRDRNKNLNKSEKKEKKKKCEVIEIYLDEEDEKQIREMLNSIKTEFPHPIQKAIPKFDAMSDSEDEAAAMDSDSDLINETNPDDWKEVTNVKRKSDKSIKQEFSKSKEVKLQSANAKYEHLEESAFKKKFLRSITGTIEKNVMDSLNTKKLVRNPELDKQMVNKLNSKIKSYEFQSMLSYRKKLPAFKMMKEISDTITSNQVVVISGETGCGKTTQVAQFILDNEIQMGNGSITYIVCTQPRRISAISVAERVAEERCEVIGMNSVGYQIRLESKLPNSRGAILYCTTGILLKKLAEDPALLDVSHLILDEIHERDTLSDFVITILKDVLPKRSDLKLILMSASLNAESFSRYYNNCAMLHIPGITFEVKQYYLEDVLEMTKYGGRLKEKISVTSKRNRKKKQEQQDYSNMIEPYIRLCELEKKYSKTTLKLLENMNIEEIDLEMIVDLVEYICYNKNDGAILIFLPGWDKISQLHSLLQESQLLKRKQCLFIPLHSMISTMQQKSAFKRPGRGVRKIIISTNIAETSITIDDIVYVIDSGKTKMKNFDVLNNITTLKEEWVSLANATQRKGRAGRVRKGECYHLFSRAREQELASYPLPELMRTRLEEVILQAKMLQVGYIKPFLSKVMNPPDLIAIDISLELLMTLNALDDEENLTPLGYHLAKLPLDPQTGKMILFAAIFSCVDPIFSVAASLNHRDPFIIPPIAKKEAATEKWKELAGNTKSDHLAVVQAIYNWETAEKQRRGFQFAKQYFLSHSNIAFLCNLKKQFAQELYGMKFLNFPSEKNEDANLYSNNISVLKAIICAGLYPNVAIIRDIQFKSRRVIKYIDTPEDGKVQLHLKSINYDEHDFESRFLMYHLKLKSFAVCLHDTTMVFPLPLLFFGHKFEISRLNEMVVITVSKDIQFTCLESTALLIKELRQRLDLLLEHKICHPGVINWSPDSDEGILLRAIIKLISSEDKRLTNVYKSDEALEEDESGDSDSDDYYDSP
uniref:RNA helicase n=1 Tax=Clastoptera arizonana TaxID=38151 RepID=A0A1B6EDU7_9HEMI